MAVVVATDIIFDSIVVIVIVVGNISIKIIVITFTIITNFTLLYQF